MGKNKKLFSKERTETHDIYRIFGIKLAVRDKKKEFGPIVTCLKQVQGVMEKIKSDGVEDSSVIELMYAGIVGAVASAKHYLTTHASLITWSQYGRDRKAFCRIITEPSFMDKRCAEIGISKNPDAKGKINKGEHEYISQGKDVSSADILKRVEALRNSIEKEKKEMFGKVLGTENAENLDFQKEDVDLFLEAKEQSLKDKDGNLQSLEEYIFFKGLAGKTPREMIADKNFKLTLARELRKENFQTGLDFTRNRASFENGSISVEEYQKNLSRINNTVKEKNAAFVEELLNAFMWEENTDNPDLKNKSQDSEKNNKSNAMKKMKRDAYRVALLELVEEIRFSGSLNDKNTGSGLERIGFGEDDNAAKLQQYQMSVVSQKDGTSSDMKTEIDIWKEYNEARIDYQSANQKLKEYNVISQYPKDIWELEEKYKFQKVKYDVAEKKKYSEAFSGLEAAKLKLQEFNEENGTFEDLKKELQTREKRNEEIKPQVTKIKAHYKYDNDDVSEKNEQNGVEDNDEIFSDEDSYTTVNFYEGDLGKNQVSFDKAYRNKVKLVEEFDNNEKRISQIKELFDKEKGYQQEIHDNMSWLFYYACENYQETEKEMKDLRPKIDEYNKSLKQKRDNYSKKLLREEGELRKKCGGLNVAEEQQLAKRISGKIMKGFNLENDSLKEDVKKLLYSYVLRYQDRDNEMNVLGKVRALLTANVWKYFPDNKWSKMDNMLLDMISDMTIDIWKTLHNNYVKLLETKVDNINTGFDYEKVDGVNVVPRKDIVNNDENIDERENDENLDSDEKFKLNNDAVQIQANTGEYAVVLSIYNGIQNEIMGLDTNKDGEKKKYYERYKKIITNMSGFDLSDTVSLEEYISKGNADFTEFMGDEETKLELNMLTDDTMKQGDEHQDNANRNISPIEKFIRLVMIERINGEYIDAQLLGGGSQRELMKIASDVHNANMSYINIIDSLFKQKNGFSLVDMTFVNTWKYSSKNEEYRAEAMANRRKYEEYKRSVNNKLMDYRRNPSSSKDVGDVARVGYDNIQNNPDANMNIQTKPVDNNKTQPAVNKNIRLDDAEQRTLRKNYEKYGMRMTSGYHVKDMNNAERKSLEESRQKYFIHYTKEVLSKMRYEELIEAKNFFKTIEAQELDDYKIIVEEIKKRDEEQKEVDWLRTQAFYADDL